MKATNLGIFYMQIPSKIIVNDLGKIVQPKYHNGSWYVVKDRKPVSISKLPKFDYTQAMNFKQIFCDDKI